MSVIVILVLPMVNVSKEWVNISAHVRKAIQDKTASKVNIVDNNIYHFLNEC